MVPVLAVVVLSVVPVVVVGDVEEMVVVVPAVDVVAVPEERTERQSS